ncbi:nifJ, partial [Symbiodinium microadriaticum]
MSCDVDASSPSTGTAAAGSPVGASAKLTLFGLLCGLLCLGWQSLVLSGARWLESLLATCGVLTVVFPALWGAFFRNFGCGGWGGFLDADRGVNRRTGSRGQFSARPRALSVLLLFVLFQGCEAGRLHGYRFRQDGLLLSASWLAISAENARSASAPQEAAPMVQIVASHCEPFSSAPYSALLAQLQDVVLRGHRRASVLMRALRCDWARLSPLAGRRVGEASHPGPAGLKANWRKQSGLAQPISKGEIAKMCRSNFTEFLEQWAAHQPPQRGSWDDWRKWPRGPDQDYADWRASDAEWHGDHGCGSCVASAKARWKKRRGKADTPGTWRLDERVWKADKDEERATDLSLRLWSSRSRLFHCLFFVLPLVVRASFDKAFGEDHWEDIVRKPSHFARLWTGASGVAQAGVIDAFGFQRSGTRITGMLRLRTSDAASRLWKCSGQLANGTRWFIDLVGDAEDLTFAQDVGVQWLPWTSDETYGDYMARAAAKAGLGLVLGRGIGVRMNRSDPSYQRPSVMWRMRSIPSHFMMTDVKELAEAMGFEAVVMSTRHRTRRGHDWCFRAVRGDALQIVSQTVQWDPDDPSTSEVVVLKESARRGTRMSAGEAIAEPRTVTFNDALAVARGPGAPKRAARKARAVDERRAPSVPDGPGESMTVDSEGRAPGDQWGPPGEWLTNDGQGNCLVLALSQLDLGGRERTHRQLRRFIVAAFQEYRSDLEPLWQKAGRFNTIGRFPHDGHAFSWSPLPLSTSSELELDLDKLSAYHLYPLRCDLAETRQRVSRDIEKGAVMPYEEAVEMLKKSIKKMYGKK